MKCVNTFVYTSILDFEMTDLNKLLTFSDAILIKKIGASIKYIREERSDFVCADDYTGFDKEKLAELCLSFEKEVKTLKDERIHKKNQAMEQQRLEEEEERAIKLAERKEKEQFVLDNSIVDCSRMDRLKFRFFNLSTFDPEDPDGLNPLNSPPFYETKEEQFSEELANSPFKVYAATYNGENMSGRPDFMQKNLNKSFVSMVEESAYIKMLFVSFRIIIKDDDSCVYESVWISNMKKELSTIPDFDNFDFTEVSNRDITFNLLQDATLMDQIFAR